MNYGKNKFKIIFTAIIFFGVFGLAKSSEAAPPAGSNWELTFSDEFDGTQVDGSKWIMEDNYCWPVNNEIEIYNKSAFSVIGGILRITASRTVAGCGNGSTRYYQSGRMTTASNFYQAYGYFEARMKVPKGKGLWPAWWMTPPDQWPPEIDITEILGGQINTTYMTYHWPVGGSYQSSGNSWNGPDFSQDFHIFAVDWEPGLIVWYVDGIERWRYENGNVASIPLRLLLNLAVGGWAGTPDSDTVFPAYMDVDWVRIYKKTSAIDTTPPAAPQGLSVQ